MKAYSFLVLGLASTAAFGALTHPGPSRLNATIERSVEMLRASWKAAPQYNYQERDVDGHGSKQYQVLMILGSPYRRLEAVNGMPLSAEDQKKEKEKLDQVVAERCAASASQQDRRVQQYLKDRERDHQMMSQLARAFDFRLVGRQMVNGHQTLVFAATPRPGYQPPNDESKALTGMRGRLWIDEQTFQWVKVHARVVRPVSIEGFLATVEPGTEFELDRAPIANGTWLPTHFEERAKAEVLSFIGHKTYDNETYFDYRKTELSGAGACPAK